MNLSLTISLLALLASPLAAQTYIQPVVPGSNIPDYSRGGMRIDGNSVTPTAPGSNGSIPDYSRPGYVIDREAGRITPTWPGTSIPDYRKPAYVIQNN